jgi:hypothetical protein
LEIRRNCGVVRQTPQPAVMGVETLSGKQDRKITLDMTAGHSREAHDK